MSLLMKPLDQQASLLHGLLLSPVGSLTDVVAGKSSGSAGHQDTANGTIDLSSIANSGLNFIMGYL